MWIPLRLAENSPHCLSLSIVVCGLGFFSIYFCPPLPRESDPKLADLNVTCSDLGSDLSFCDPTQRCTRDDFLASLSADLSVTCQLQCQQQEREREGGPSTTITTKQQEDCALWDIEQCPDHLNLSIVANIGQFSRVRHCTTFPAANLSVEGMEVQDLTCTNTTTTTTTVTPVLTCRGTCDDPGLMTFLGAPPTKQAKGYEEVTKHTSFWLHLLCMVVAWSGLAVCVVMSDTICFQLLGAEGERYGQQRLFGSLGWGTLVVITGALIDYASLGQTEKDYTPAFVLSLAILFIDLLAATRLQVEGREKAVAANVGTVVRLVCEPRIVLFILCCVVVGVSTGILWTYQLMLVEDVAFGWDCHFPHLKLLQGLVMGVQCFGGELPFFFISGFFIRTLGHANAMSLVVAVFGLRYVLYYAISNPWVFLPVELLNGFTFGIFYATMTSYASQVAPPGMQATLQGIVGASFEGIGVAMGGFVGGALFFTVGGGRTFLYTGIFNILFAVLHVCLHLLLHTCWPTDADSGAGSPPGYIPPSESMRPVTATEEDVEDGM
ncbi:major facilitator superfamily domain-containing protein 6-A-like [Portunus trituberculatus]|uniref:major facilitator superfamily domain-containing protein 6-A-like n=1 Tax=Portunus trituberculatus TaxID=210409 RepID=UPI001E1CCA65|nr:major facilitator superfamily domain-containing protein 6-A-like [Portunus trituberculatus]